MLVMKCWWWNAGDEMDDRKEEKKLLWTLDRGKLEKKTMQSMCVKKKEFSDHNILDIGSNIYTIIKQIYDIATQQY